MKIGSRLKNIRKQKKLTQKDVAEHLSISTMSYSRYEQDLRQPDLETLTKLAKLYGVGVDFFFDNLYYYKDLDDEFEIDFHVDEMDEEYYMLQSALSRKLEIEKKARKLIRRLEGIVEDGDPYQPRELEYIKKKLGTLFTENREIEELIEVFGGYSDVEDAIIETLSKLSVKRDK